jgi:hypothetical protein
MGVELSSAVLRHLARVRENPARAVDPGEIEELERYAREDASDRFLARMAPEANYTWLSRVELDTSADESDIDTIDDFGCRVEVLGLFPTVLALEASPKVLPPIEAFDVQIAVDRGARELRTAANSPVTGGQQRPQFAPLASVSSTIANRIMRLTLGLDGTVSTISFTYRWAVSSAVRTALSWSNVQLSMGVFYEPTGDPRRPRGGK